MSGLLLELHIIASSESLGGHWRRLGPLTSLDSFKKTKTKNRAINIAWVPPILLWWYHINITIDISMGRQD